MVFRDIIRLLGVVTPIVLVTRGHIYPLAHP